LDNQFITDKREVPGRWVAIMDYSRNDRNLELTPYKSRCMKKGEVHEFLVCDSKTDISKSINNVSYIGFGEITESGVIEPGDNLIIDGEIIGEIIGFDESHMPNHYNIIIRCKNLNTGKEIGLQPFGAFEISSNK